MRQARRGRISPWVNKGGRNKGKMDGVGEWTENKGGRAAWCWGVARWRDLKRETKRGIWAKKETNERTVEKESDWMRWGREGGIDWERAKRKTGTQSAWWDGEGGNWRGGCSERWRVAGWIKRQFTVITRERGRERERGEGGKQRWEDGRMCATYLYLR